MDEFRDLARELVAKIEAIAKDATHWCDCEARLSAGQCDCDAIEHVQDLALDARRRLWLAELAEGVASR